MKVASRVRTKNKIELQNVFKSNTVTAKESGGMFPLPDSMRDDVFKCVFFANEFKNEAGGLGI